MYISLVTPNLKYAVQFWLPHHAQIFFEALPVAVGDYRVSDFRIICEFCYKIVKSKIDVGYVYYEQYCSENRALWDATSDWCPIRGRAIDNHSLFSIV